MKGSVSFLTEKNKINKHNTEGYRIQKYLFQDAKKKKLYNCTLEFFFFFSMKLQRFSFNLSSVQLYGFIFCILKKHFCVLYPSVLCLFIFSVREINESLNLLCKCFIRYK